MRVIKIRELENGYQYEASQTGGDSICTQFSVLTPEITGFDVIKRVVSEIEYSEKERKAKDSKYLSETKEKIEREERKAHQITQTLETLAEGEYATKDSIRKIIQEEIAKIRVSK